MQVYSWRELLLCRSHVLLFCDNRSTSAAGTLAWGFDFHCQWQAPPSTCFVLNIDRIEDAVFTSQPAARLVGEGRLRIGSTVPAVAILQNAAEFWLGATLQVSLVIGNHAVMARTTDCTGHNKQGESAYSVSGRWLVACARADPTLCAGRQTSTDRRQVPLLCVTMSKDCGDNLFGLTQYDGQCEFFPGGQAPLPVRSHCRLAC